MERTVRLKLKDVPIIPPSLLKSLATPVAAEEITINLANLFHNYWRDEYGDSVPAPNISNFEYLPFISATSDFRMAGDGIGSPYTDAMRRASTRLGQAFCRTFLQEHFQITYFAHISEILKRAGKAGFDSFSIHRAKSGDTPDYFCADGNRQVYLAEAKGKHSSIGFSTKEFQKWRDQFSRVTVTNASGEAQHLKGYIVATRFSTENKPNLNTTIFAEDPNTLGNAPLNPSSMAELNDAVVGIHYSRIAKLLRQHILAASLESGALLPKEISVNAIVWEGLYGPIAGRRFVGGYFPSKENGLPIRIEDGKFIYQPVDKFRLDSGGHTFYGLEIGIFKNLVRRARRGRDQNGISLEGVADFDIRPFEIEPFYSAVSILRDGSAIAPLEFFAPVDELVIAD